MKAICPGARCRKREMKEEDSRRLVGRLVKGPPPPLANRA